MRWFASATASVPQPCILRGPHRHCGLQASTSASSPYQWPCPALRYSCWPIGLKSLTSAISMPLNDGPSFDSCHFQQVHTERPCFSWILWLEVEKRQVKRRCNRSQKNANVRALTSWKATEEPKYQRQSSRPCRADRDKKDSSGLLTSMNSYVALLKVSRLLYRWRVG